MPVVEFEDGRCLAQSNAIIRYLARDSWGYAYTRGAVEVERVRQVLGTTDGAALAGAVRSARVAAQHARTARRRAFESRRVGVAGPMA